MIAAREGSSAAPAGWNGVSLPALLNMCHCLAGERPYRDDSLLVGNYANTLLNDSFDSGEFVPWKLWQSDNAQLSLLMLAVA